MKTYEEILKAKIDYYGETKAAYEFAADEFLQENLNNLWIDVKMNHFAEITPLETGGFSWVGELDSEFLVAVPLKSGWYIEKVILIDKLGLKLVDPHNDNYIDFPYEMTDITHWQKITYPKN